MAARLGPYEVLGELGRGGMGVVLKARAPDGRLVAIKLLREANAERVERFDRERRLQSQLGEGAGFVPLIEAGFQPGAGPYLVLPFLAGGTLRQRFAKSALTHHDVRRLGVMLAQAMGRAHDAGIVHRDLKPENVLFTEQGRPLIADLGLAKHFDRGVEGASLSVALSVDGRMQGTVGYMAPEQCVDASAVGPPADVFAIGSILYEALSGKPAFEADNTLALIGKVAEGRYESLSGLAVESPPWLISVIERCLDKAPERRYQDGEALAHALREGVTNASAVQSSWTTLRWRPKTRSVLLWLWVVALVVALGAVLAVTAKVVKPSGPDVQALAREALAPGVSALAIREKLTALRLANAPAAVVAPVEKRLDERTAAEALAALAGKKPDDIEVSALVEAAEAAVRAPSLPNLVGERKEGLALGTALLDRYAKLGRSPAEKATAARIVSVATALAEARLAIDPEDAGAHFLRAGAALAADGSPPRAFALARPFPGFREGTPAHRALRADLEAATKLAGAPGDRAAWLLVDLLACAGPGVADEAIAAALAKARERGDPEKLGARFERLLAKPPEATFRALVDELAGAEGKERVDAAALLGRFLAHLGSVDALDDPELAAGLTTPAAVLQREGDTFPYPELPPGVAETLGAIPDGADAARTQSYDTSVLIADRTDERRVAQARAVFDVKPLAVAIEHASVIARAWGSSVVLDVLQEDGPIGQGGFSWLETRTRAVGVVLLGKEGGDFLDVTIPHSLVASFDKAFAKDVAKDGLLAAAIAHGLDEGAALRARRIVEGIARVAALRDNPPEPAATRLALEGLLRLSDLDRSRGPRLLPLRAQIRGRGLPEPLASTLALLDYERVARSLERAVTPLRRDRAAILGVCTANEPFDLFHDRGRPLAQRLARVGLFWTKEHVHAEHDGQPPFTPEDFDGSVMHYLVRGMLDFLDTNRPGRPTSDDLARLGGPFRPRRYDGRIR